MAMQESPHYKAVGGDTREACAAKDYLNLAELFNLIIYLNVWCLRFLLTINIAIGR